GALNRLAGREAQPPVRPAVERPREGDNRRTPRGMPRQLDGAFDGFGSRVREKHPLLALAGRELRQSLAQCGEALEVEIAAADVQELSRRFLDRLNHP